MRLLCCIALMLLVSCGKRITNSSGIDAPDYSREYLDCSQRLFNQYCTDQIVAHRLYRESFRSSPCYYRYFMCLQNYNVK